MKRKSVHRSSYLKIRNRENIHSFFFFIYVDCCSTWCTGEFKFSFLELSGFFFFQISSIHRCGSHGYGVQTVFISLITQCGVATSHLWSPRPTPALSCSLVVIMGLPVGSPVPSYSPKHANLNWNCYIICMGERCVWNVLFFRMIYLCIVHASVCTTFTCLFTPCLFSYSLLYAQDVHSSGSIKLILILICPKIAKYLKL